MEKAGETNYRHFLNLEFERRAATNSSYSLRAFARDIGLSPSTISEILSGKHGLSKIKAEKIADRLGLTNLEKDNFIDMVEATHGRTEIKKQRAKQRIKVRAKERYLPMNLDAFQAIKDWYHFAIVELTYVKNFNSNTKWIAEKLGLNEKLTQQAIDRLLRLGLLSLEKDRIVATEDYTAVGNQTSSEAIKNFHKQILQRAMEELILQPVENREFSSSVMAIDKSDLPNAREDLIKFRREFSEKYENKRKKNSVYCLSMQFFELTKKEDSK